MFLRREHLAALVVAASLAAHAQPTYAQWHVNGVPLCTALGDQYQPAIVTDGAGGAIVTWDDRTGGNPGIYAQHVLASGVVDPAWTTANGNPNGTPLCTAVGEQLAPTIVTDGAGGAIVTWDDRGNPGIYAQHVLASGGVDPAWPVDGRALCTGPAGQQVYPTIATDGAGGAIVTWTDARSGTSADIYAQHVLASGVVDPAWPANGRALCTAAYNQDTPTIVTDGAGGAIVTWEDIRSGTNEHIYAQHVLASGVVDPAWTAANGNVDGTPVCTAAGGRQFPPTIVTDGTGGAIVAWQDNRSGDADIYAQHVLASGAVDPAWPADGRPLCTAAGLQNAPKIVTDGAGGAIVTWQDYGRGVDSFGDIYAQHVLASGGVDPAWPADGRALCTAGGGQVYPTIATDGAGGAIVTWTDYRGGADIYAQHVLASGGVDPAWPADGRALCTAAGDQDAPKIVTDGAGGAIVTWTDPRSGTNSDIYAQRVSGSGGVTAVAPRVPASFAVRAPHPNPARAASTISFDLPAPQRVSVGVYDVTGQLVRTLAGGGELPAGTHSLMWNGASDSGAPARAGIYFIRVSARSAVETRRVAILR